MYSSFVEFENKIRSIVTRCGSDENKMIKLITSMRDPYGDPIKVSDAVYYIEAIYKDMYKSQQNKTYGH